MILCHITLPNSLEGSSGYPSIQRNTARKDWNTENRYPTADSSKGTKAAKGQETQRGGVDQTEGYQPSGGAPQPSGGAPQPSGGEPQPSGGASEILSGGERPEIGSS